MQINFYYLRKYVGAKEFILLALLFFIGILLFVWLNNVLMLIMSVVTLLLIGGTLGFYYATVLKGYREEYLKRGVSKWVLKFDEEGVEIEVHEGGGDRVYREKRLYREIDRIALLKDRVYLFAATTMMYYVRPEHLVEGNFVELCEFLKEKVPPVKFKMKQKRPRQFGR